MSKLWLNEDELRTIEYGNPEKRSKALSSLVERLRKIDHKIDLIFSPKAWPDGTSDYTHSPLSIVKFAISSHNIYFPQSMYSEKMVMACDTLMDLNKTPLKKFFTSEMAQHIESQTHISVVNPELTNIRRSHKEAEFNLILSKGDYIDTIKRPSPLVLLDTPSNTVLSGSW